MRGSYLDFDFVVDVVGHLVLWLGHCSTFKGHDRGGGEEGWRPNKIYVTDLLAAGGMWGDEVAGRPFMVIRFLIDSRFTESFSHRHHQ